MDEKTRRLTAEGLAVVVAGGSLGVAGVGLIIGSLAAWIIGARGGVQSACIVGTVVVGLTTVTGLVIRQILINPFELCQEKRLVEHRSSRGASVRSGQTSA